MHSLSRTRSLAVSASATVALAAAVLAPAASAARHRHPHPEPPSAPVFVQTDGLAGNAIVAYDRGADGSLTPAGMYPTGGLGGQLDGSVVDHTASQGALAASGDALYAVNAGSDTVTAFRRLGDRLLRVQTVPTFGRFPVSVAVRGDLVYVLNARDGGSIQGYRRVGPFLVPLPFSHRALGLDPRQTPEFTHTPGQVAFTPDGRQLVVSTKGNTNAVVVFALGRFGTTVGAPVTTPLPGTVPFGVDFDASGHLIVAQAGTATVSSYAITDRGDLRGLSTVATGQAATCWVTVAGDMLYASNAGTSTVSEIRDDGTALSLAGTVPGPAGTTDAAPSPDGRYLEVQGGALGQVSTYAIGGDGLLGPAQTLTVPGAVGGEGIAVPADGFWSAH